MGFKWVTYALAVGIWNTLFTGIIVAICNIAYICLGKPTVSMLDMITTYIFGYVILFMLNINIIDEE